MAPTSSYQENYHTTLGGSPFAHPIPSPSLRTRRPSHRYSFRRVSFAHQRRFRSRQYPGSPPVFTSASAVNGPPPLYTPTIDLHPSIITPTGFPGTITADLRQSQTHHRMSATAIALIVVCILVGLALSAVIGHFVYRRKRLPRLRWPWRTRREEDSLGFVFVEYDDSTWGTPTPAKGSWKEMPTFEDSAQEREGGEAHATPPLSAPKPDSEVEVHPVPSIQPDPVAPPDNRDDDNRRELTLVPLTQTGSDPLGELNTIVETTKRDHLDDTASPTGDTGPHIGAGKSVIGNTLGLPIGDHLELSFLTSSELAAVLALHAEVGTLDVLARPGVSEYRPLDVSEDEETETSVSDSLSSGLVACVSSSTEESSASEDNYELHRVETRSMDFKRGIIVSLGATTDTDGEGDEKPLPRVVISGSSSDVFSSQSHRVSGMSEGTIDLGDFPRPPVICL